ncbi:MAG: response regulator [Methylacidiphilales bacterium]|nr:response regulator [Candidatus Methylacidiphilales bacterium]
MDLQTQVIPRDAKRHILHVEDDPEVAGSIGQLLETNGYEVTHAADGLSGLLAFNQNPDLWSAVLIDLNLPHVSGNALIKEMHQARPNLPLIVLTGTPPGTNLDVYELGAVILWQKPISSTELLENLRALIHV